MDLHPDFRDLLAALAQEGVSYVVIGGYAVGHHAKPRATKDLDVLVSGTTENLERLARALLRFGAPTSVIELARHMSESEIVYLGTEPVRIDILRSADGIDADAAIARHETVILDDLSVPVIGLEDLIVNKRASGRPQDVADLALLERAKAKS
ncbi:MAG TPA: nucleotidyltransferase [Polyangiaceae bacterium]|nr:nucleotidyltransferase [Polyangiaceae bacterium]